jgi:deazaflavin-dependent oxidoreductase (nitroreductase family)
VNTGAVPVERGRTWRAFSRFISIPVISRLAMSVASKVDRPMLRLSRGRYRLSFVIPCLLLRVRGAHTGTIREVPLLYVPDGEDVLLIGSGGGADREPAWATNLRRNPEVTTLRAGREEARRSTLLVGVEREQAWRLAVAIYPGFERYQARVSRQIPVFRLRRTP